MTKAGWLSAVEKNKDVIGKLLEQYHPRSVKRKMESLRITAPAAEAAAENVRRHIVHRQMLAAATASQPEDQFAEALASQDARRIFRLLEELWFGVPESSDCWQLPGFTTCVELLDDPPEDDYNPNEDDCA